MIKIDNITLNREIDKRIKEIFIEEDINNLTKYQKRKKIYEWLVNNSNYDFGYFEKIKNSKSFGTPFPRDSRKELILSLNGYGVCNGFAQVYKLFLEKMEIFSYCIICMIKDGDSFVGHQLNLVYDDDTDSYSFDDVTLGIIKKQEDYFDYDLTEANKMEELQGIQNIINNQKWIILDEEYFNYIVDRNTCPLNNKIIKTDIPITKNDDFDLYNIKIISKKYFAKTL
ncbi:MAG: hypothetical protein J6D28_03460 [Bacilli bacterium]|nr:hypothetical protein [Bacilli bacterium]